MKSCKTLFIIPTRNRADLAIRSIESLLNQKDCEFQIVVSDNSTDALEIDSLKKFCFRFNKQIEYIQPPGSLSMTKHWDWALKEVIRTKEFSHITFLTDRMLFVPTAFSELKKILLKFPSKIVSYYFQGVSDYAGVPSISKIPFTGKLFEVKSDHLLTLSSEINIVSALPRIMNCIVPRLLIEKILDQNDFLFESISPDYYFAYKILDEVESILFFDKPLLISHAESRGNGNNAMRGVLSEPSIDFYQTVDYPVTINTPLPFMMTPTDAVLNEYEYVKKKSKSGKFREIDSQKYELRISTDVVNFNNSKIKLQGIIALYKNYRFRMLKYHLKGLFPLRHWLSMINHNDRKIEFKNSKEAVDYLLNDQLTGGSEGQNYLEMKIGYNSKYSPKIKEIQYD